MNLNSEVPCTCTCKVHANSVPEVRGVEGCDGLDGCSGSTLKADQACEFRINFTPSSNGVKRSNVIVESDATEGPGPIEVVSSSGVVHFDGFEENVCR